VKLNGISSLRLDTLTLSQVLNGTINKWNDAKIAALNPGLTLPNTTITVVSRADTSGSTGNLKTYLNKNLTALGTSGSTAAIKALANAQKVKWTSGGQTQADEFARGGIGATGSPALVKAVGDANGRIGYADLSDVTSDLTIVTMQNVAGQWVKPTAASAALYVAASGVLTSSSDTTNTTNGGIYTVDFTKSVANAYQITFITYFVGKKGQGTKNDQVRLYANYVLNKCSPTPSTIGATGYVTVGSALIANAKSQVAKITN
jgi:phosphate transport system substrate-binding protein